MCPDILGQGKKRDFPTISAHRLGFLLFHFHAKLLKNNRVAEIRVSLSDVLAAPLSLRSEDRS